MTPPQSFEADSIYTVYQPIVEIRSGRILGYEALTRARQGGHEPEELFFRAYQRGATIDLDLECLRSAVRVLPEFPHQELLFVNIEPVTLSSPVLHQKPMKRILRKCASYQNRVVFELTEGMKPRDFEHIKKGVASLKKQGYRFAIDDVSAVGPKLFQLLTLWPDFVKIDMSLIRGLGLSRIRQTLVRRIVHLAGRKGCYPIAEGVEKKKDLESVKKLGIPYAQGFYFSRPRRTIVKSGFFARKVKRV
jgi:EAL domain-containing protein (putative c-di-GMP-specific phosphodiesterase class I)